MKSLTPVPSPAARSSNNLETEHIVSVTFSFRTLSMLALSSVVLGAGLLVAMTGLHAKEDVKAQQTKVRLTRTQVEENLQRAQAYALLIERIGWRPGQSLRHEKIDTSATISGNEGDRLNEILRANHVGKGQFFLRSLSMETQRSQRDASGTLKLSIKGDNILVLDRP